MASPTRSSRTRLTLVFAVALAILPLIVFAPVVGFGFLSWDDPSYVTQNPHVLGGLTLAGLRWAFTTGDAANWHPLTWLAHMLDVQLFRLDAGRHHAMNLAIHATNTVLLFFVLLTMTTPGAREHARVSRGTAKNDARALPGAAAIGASAFAAALFAVHPLHVESVAWIAERKDVLSTCLWLMTMMCYVTWTRSEKISWYTATCVCFALGLMAKPMLVTLPLVLLLIDVWPLNRWSPGKRVREKIPLFLLAAASAIVTFAVQRAGGAVGSVTELPWTFRVTNALASYTTYLWRTIWPAHLSAFYPYPQQPPLALAAAGVAMLIAISVAAIRLRGRRPYILVGWFWFVITLVPVIGLIQVGDQATADRYAYVPLIGVFILVAWGAREWAARWKAATPALLFAGMAVITCLSITARAQVDTWRDNATVWGHALEVTEGNYRAHLGLADAFSDAGDAGRAIPEYRAALQLVPGAAAIHNSLGLTLTATGDLSGAADEYRAAIRSDPRNADAHVNLGAMLARANHPDDAIAEYERAIAIDPRLALAHNNLCLARAATGHVADAIPECLAALALAPGDAQWRYQTAMMLESAGRVPEAIAQLRQALALNPGHALARQALDRLTK